MRHVFLNNKILFFVYLIIAAILSIFLIYHGKTEAHILLTGFHTLFLDKSMVLLTWFGDGLFMVFVGLILLFVKARYGLIILSSFLASSLFVQILKRLVFSGCKRPVAWFQDLGIEIYRISGIEYHSSFSFPSGHTTTAFALFFGLAFFIGNGWLKILFLLLALLTGFSRIYLSQHFLGDVLAGSILGIAVAVVMQSVFKRIEAKWMEKNIVSLIRKKNVSS